MGKCIFCDNQVSKDSIHMYVCGDECKQEVIKQADEYCHAQPTQVNIGVVEWFAEFDDDRDIGDGTYVSAEFKLNDTLYSKYDNKHISVVDCVIEVLASNDPMFNVIDKQGNVINPFEHNKK